MQAQGEGSSNGRTRRRVAAVSRAACLGAVAGMSLILTGDRGALTAPIGGIDPLEVLDLQVKNNVLFVFDTSGSMKFPTGASSFPIGPDDPMSRMYQAKQAVRQVIQANIGKLSFGLASYNVTKPLAHINREIDNDDDRGGGTADTGDGPFIYVSVDDAAAAPFYGSFTCPNDGGATLDGFWCRTTANFGDWDGTEFADVFRSFYNRVGNSNAGNGGFDDPYPLGCTPFNPATDPFLGPNHCRYYLQSRLFRSERRFTWNLASNDINTRLVSTQTITCPLPPAGLTGENPDGDGDGFSDSARPCIEMVDQATGQVARFFYTSAIFQPDSTSTGVVCGGAAILTPVAACTEDNTKDILDEMLPELPVVDANNLQGVADPANTVRDYRDIDPDPSGGLRATQATPIANSLNNIMTADPAAFPPRPPEVADVQLNFVIFLSDGDDTCEGGSLDANATAAARAAEDLYYNGGGPGAGNADPQHQAETMFIAFTEDVNVARANKIAQAGSGGNVQGNGSVSCPPDVPCRVAFTASTTEQLVEALQNALQFAATGGTFAASATTVATVFELAADDPATPAPAIEGPLDPRSRYSDRVNILFQPTFEMPSFDGHLLAFRNDGTFLPLPDNINFTGNWDAGETLFENVSQFMEVQSRAGRPNNKFTFSELHGGASVENVGSSTALIRRRIFTSDGNGRFPRTTDVQFDSSVPQGRNVVALWPPNQIQLSTAVSDIDPAVGTVGPLDVALGISNLTFDELRAEFGACDFSTDPSSGPLPSSCDNVADSALAADTARKEARQIILAYTAGARLDRSILDSKPLRDTTSSELLYRDRGWIMVESTLSQPAVVTPPLRNTPSQHVKEFLLFRDGRRDETRQGIPEVHLGFGLRNPDLDDPDPQSDLELKPVMTVVYMGSNSMLHAFKAETSQELWGFVPFDQLGKLRQLMRPQGRDDHTYVIASSPRASFIFIPGPFTISNVTFEGRWRTILVFGRGPGGKHYTTLDVTAPGPFTRPALETNPPWVLFSRGNPDTVDGTPAGTQVRTADFEPYSRMGYTWSVPAVGNVKPLPSPLPSPAPPVPPGGYGVEWRLFTGSGYGDTAQEGTTFYVLDPTTGDVIDAREIGDGTPTFFPDNALVADAAAYNPFFLDVPTLPTRSTDAVTRVYIPDIHGRVWKFAAGSGGKFADEGPQHPFGDAVALLKIRDEAHVFVASGNDNRVHPPPSPTPPFRMFAYRDIAGDGLSPEAGERSFCATPPCTFDDSLEFPTPFRGSSQPATFFNELGNGRVVFAGTRFNPPNETCLSSFDTIIFALGAETGDAAFNFGTGLEPSKIFEDIKDDIRGAGGQVIISDSGSRTRPPAPPTPGPGPQPYGEEPPKVVTTNKAVGSPICRQ